MIGGFLGAGKTTAVAQLARRLADRGMRVGLITNDQGSGLVDTAMLASRGFPVQEIVGGCFCCRFNSLAEAARRLTETTRPDVFIAEPVGSCTDLVATVSYPLRRIYGDRFTVAPLSVLVDPLRAARVFGLADGAKFSEKVRYIYAKQLEEADLIVINKCDLIAQGQTRALRARLEGEFPRAKVLEMSARNGRGLKPWFDRITRDEQSARASMTVDYDVYADGEALLGWLNATVELSAKRPFDGNAVLDELARGIQQHLNSANAEVAHCKMTLDPGGAFGDLGIVNLVRSDYVPELSQTLPAPIRRGQLIVNLRAEAAPELLREALERALKSCGRRHAGLRAELTRAEQFRPGRPVPTHRMASPV